MRHDRLLRPRPSGGQTARILLLVSAAVNNNFYARMKFTLYSRFLMLYGLQINGRESC